MGACVGARVSPESRGRRRAGTARLVAALAGITVTLSLAASPAGAIIASVGGHGYGVTPLRGVSPTSIAGANRSRNGGRVVRPFDEPPFGGGQLAYLGGPVMQSNTTHVIYWDPGKEFTATTTGIINGFFTDVAHDSGMAANTFAVDAQYTDSAGGNAAYKSTFAGPRTDEENYPTSACTAPTEVDAGPPYTHCLLDSQLRTELSAFISKEKLPKGPTQLYFLVLPHRVVTCFKAGECSSNIFCAYHSYINPGTESEIIYADIPFSLLDAAGPSEFVDAKGCQADKNEQIQNPNADTAGTNASTRYADVALKYIGHEYSEAITDPLVNFNTAWVDAEGFENGDKCNSAPYGVFEEGEPGFDKHAFQPTLGGLASAGTLFNQSIDGGHFYLQSEWDNVAGACRMQPLPVSAAAFTATPSEGATQSPVTFNGVASDPYGSLEIGWNFGDTTTGAGASPTHAYTAPGSYEVTMTARDRLTGSTSGPVVHTLVVDEPPAAAFTSAPSGAVAGAAVAFDGSGSSDPDGAIIGYAWSFGDGATGSGATISHAYASAGSYTVTLTVTDSNGHSATATHSVTIAAAQTVATSTIAPLVIPPASSVFTSGATFNATSGVATATVTVAQPGTFKWLLTFQNGKFGVFAASASKCKKGFVRLGGKCRPAKVVFARGSMSVATPGAVKLAIKPTAAGLKALRDALKHKQGVPVTMTLTFQSSRGGSAVTHTRTVLVKLKKR
jgi:PKD repeat protein